MSVLKPYLDDGTLVVKSKQTDFKTVAILRWQAKAAQDRMENLLTSTYKGGTKVDGVLSPYDGLSIGILSALKSNGYGTAGQPYPVVTGQDAELASVKSIIAGEQYSTIYKDTRELAKTTVQMADAVLKGQKPPTNNNKDYDNGVKVVPSQLLESVIVDKTNYKKDLVDDRLLPEVAAGMTILEMRGITKTFPGVKALQDVNLEVRRGEIHAICGENGAGKSTLMKVLSGVYPHGVVRRGDHLRRRAVPLRAASGTASTAAS